MEEPDTEQMLNDLIDSPNPDAFARQNCHARRTLPAYLSVLLAEKGLSRPGVVRDAGINPTFGYQIFKGQRGASRNTVLQLAFTMGCTLKETNRLLQSASCNELYVKDRRDALIVASLVAGRTLVETDDELYRAGEETIC